jgi:hypothetical protein
MVMRYGIYKRWLLCALVVLALASVATLTWLSRGHGGGDEALESRMLGEWFPQDAGQLGIWLKPDGYGEVYTRKDVNEGKVAPAQFVWRVRSGRLEIARVDEEGAPEPWQQVDWRLSRDGSVIHVPAGNRIGLSGDLLRSQPTEWRTAVESDTSRRK